MLLETVVAASAAYLLGNAYFRIWILFRIWRITLSSMSDPDSAPNLFGTMLREIMPRVTVLNTHVNVFAIVRGAMDAQMTAPRFITLTAYLSLAANTDPPPFNREDMDMYLLLSISRIPYEVLVEVYDYMTNP